MADLWVWPAYVIIGIAAGASAGLFGVGGGIIVVPALAIILHILQASPATLMHLAVGTSLAVIVVTSLSSMLEHHRHGAVLWPVVLKFSPAIIIGTITGAALASKLASDYLKIIFGIIEILIALQLFFNFKPQAERRLPGLTTLSVVGAVIGVISALAGIGGGTMTGPFLNWCNVSIHKAVATSAACGVPIAVAGSVSYFIFGLSHQDVNLAVTGFILWPAFGVIAICSVVAAPMGARLAHRLPTTKLKKLFAVFLFAVGVSMLSI